MDFIPAAIEAYALAHTSAESPLLAQLNRETHAKVLQSRMLSGHLQGRLLSLFSTMLRPRRILEIGTYTGYSALCLAEGLTEDGILTTIDVNEELESFVRSFFDQSPLGHKIDFRIANAATLIPTLNETFDLVFIDADKLNYGLYYDLVFDKVRPGGVIIADNVLWSGKIVQSDKRIDKDTQALLDFNQKLHNDPRVSNVLLPVRDGLLIVWKH
ncbi:O-methyltransferase [Runella aurantiaca]|uniref:O-methyltransferase n=1 Tax=Runella aurantiaca TaxID=2282308 RepID=A0A369IEI0_9BACT|nr:O-methyltransferase [Runella aurantiaca]RDB05644.1 O-methyltransferase [Runella aurantiaca]